MTSGFTIYTTSAFRRLSRSLQKHHQEFAQVEAEAFATLRSDPYNRARRHQIKKLENVSPGKGQYRLRLGRWRFRYDIEGQDVVLYYCGLRREDTYE